MDLCHSFQKILKHGIASTHQLTLHPAVKNVLCAGLPFYALTYTSFMFNTYRLLQTIASLISDHRSSLDTCEK
jgi:hypothetical protein